MAAKAPCYDLSERQEARYVFFILLLVLLGCLLLNRMVLGGIPHGWDSAAYYFQGKVFASGRVAAPSTQLIDLFWVNHIVNRTDKRFAQYPPGWPALLAPAMLLGLPQLGNAFAAALTALFTWLCARRIFARAEAMASLLLMAISPFFLFMGANYLAHMSCALFLTAGLYFSLRSFAAEFRRRVFLMGMVAGGCVAVALLVRPFSAILGTTGILVIAMSVSRPGFQKFLLFAAGVIPSLLAGVALLMLYNLETTGSAFRLGYQLNDSTLNFLGRAGEHRATVWDNMKINLPKIAEGLGKHVWGLPWLDAGLLACALLLGWMRRELWALAAAIALFATAHSAYFYFDRYFGPRLVFETIPWLCIASGYGAIALHRVFWNRGKAARALLIAAAASALLMAGLFLVERIRYYSQNYGGQGSEVLQKARIAELDNALVFIRASEPVAYTNFFFLNDVVLHRGPLVFARYAEGRVYQAMAEFPREHTLILDLELTPLPGPDGYADRFEIKRLEWKPVHP